MGAILRRTARAVKGCQWYAKRAFSDAELNFLATCSRTDRRRYARAIRSGAMVIGRNGAVL